MQRVAQRPPDWVAPWIGLRYVKDAKPGTLEEARQAGVFCWSLFALALRQQFGQSVDDYDGPLYGGRRDARAVAEAAEQFAARWREIPADEEQAGDAIFLRMGGAAIHIGLIVAPGWMLHIEEACDSTCERYRRSDWKNQIIAFYRAEPAAEVSS